MEAESQKKIEKHTCICPKKACANNGDCAACIAKHKNTDSLPFCLFPNNDGDKSIENYYRKLKSRFGN